MGEEIMKLQRIRIFIFEFEGDDDTRLEHDSSLYEALSVIFFNEAHLTSFLNEISVIGSGRNADTLRHLLERYRRGDFSDHIEGSVLFSAEGCATYMPILETGDLS